MEPNSALGECLAPTQQPTQIQIVIMKEKHCARIWACLINMERLNIKIINRGEILNE